MELPAAMKIIYPGDCSHLIVFIHCSYSMQLYCKKTSIFCCRVSKLNLGMVWVFFGSDGSVPLKFL